MVNHCTALAVTLRSRMSRGMATAMSVSLQNNHERGNQKEIDDEVIAPRVVSGHGWIFSADGLPALAELRFKYRTPTYPALLGLNC